VIHLLDTNAFSDLMREHSSVRARVASLSAEDQIVICSIVRGEILHGIQRLMAGKRRRDLEAKAAKLFAAIPCEPVPEAAGDHYAQVKLTRARKGLTMDENDLWIAATALALGGKLVSRDRDVQQVDGLTVIDWTV
jgi:predicted nucleic acid-binding protein